MNESKIYDIVLFFNEMEILKRRILYLEDSVEMFVVINFGGNPIDLEHPKLLVIEQYKKKSHFFSNNFLDEIINLKELSSVRPQDYLLVSKTHEIPNKDDFQTIKNTQTQDISYLIHKNIFWNVGLVSDYMSVGTRVFYVSFILQDKKLYQKYFHKNLVSSIISASYKSGWSIQGLQSESEFFNHVHFWGPEKLKDKLPDLETLRYYRENILSFDYPSKISQLKIQLNPDVPEEFKDLDSGSKVRDSKDIYICLQDYKFDVPKKVLYGGTNYKTFVKSFKKNEILRILKKENLLLTDRVHIKEKTESKYSVFTYLDILKNVPSDII